MFFITNILLTNKKIHFNRKNENKTDLAHAQY